MSVQLVVWTLNYAKKVPSIFLIATVYPVIAEPPFAGATQEIVTSMFVFNEIVGAAGTLGTEAALTSSPGESAPKPIKLRAVTLNV